ncbi:MAG: flagellar motor switch phosphatase FliY [Clostridiales bacterium]|nr:flagellar motor switch phosphatase FliY [Clostridiales bacterium]
MAELSQAEIDALLGGKKEPGGAESPVNRNDKLTQEEIDTIGEVGNISMGSSATALSSLLNRKIDITTPVVSVVDLDEVIGSCEKPYVAVEISYTDGMVGNNVLNITGDDVKIITDIMMGGAGDIQPGEISELHLSAMGELMNQMIGTSATALSQMIGKRIDISPPRPILVDRPDKQIREVMNHESPVVKTVFTLSIQGKGDSEIMLLMPIAFARELTQRLRQQYLTGGKPAEEPVADSASASAPAPDPASPPTPQEEEIKVKYLQFHAFGDEKPAVSASQSRYDILMDIPLEVSVELGSVRKSISEILTFGAGTIIELNKMAGENVDILINKKLIGRGEVIVVDEAYGVRITEVIK